MTTLTKAKRIELLEKATHYLTALVILLKGLDKLETPGKLWFGIIFLLIALFITVGTFFHHRMEKWLRHFKAWVYTLEAVVMGIVGYLYMKEGKHMIQYVCFAAAVMFLVALVVNIRRSAKLNKIPAH
jgi:hypothetical protein